MRNLFIVSTTLIAGLGASPVCTAQPSSQPEYSISKEFSSTTIIKRREVAAGSVIPINKRYPDLTAEEKALVHRWFESIGPEDEPPFPIDGLKPIYAAIAEAQAKLFVTGDLLLVATVGSDGEVTSVKAIGSPSPEIAKAGAAVLYGTRFKPALCKGSPCRMDFPLRYHFNVK
jgi:hypothetical protein